MVKTMIKINEGLEIVEKIEIKKSTRAILAADSAESVERPSEQRQSDQQHSVVGDSTLARLFKAYFNNKMTVLIFLCHAARHIPEGKHINSVYCFLDDVYRHMLEENVQKQYRRKFIWLKGFLRKLPNVRPAQRVTAIKWIRSLYGVFGIDLRKELGGERK